MTGVVTAGSGGLLVAARWLLTGATFGWWLCTMCLVAVFAGAMTVSDMAIVKAQDQYSAALAAGGDVVVLASDTGALDASECAQLSRRGDVLRSGSVLFSEPDHVRSAPGVGIVMAAVDPQFLAIVSPESTTYDAGIVLARDASRAIGALKGSLVRWEVSGPTVVAGVVDVSTRAASLDRTAFAPRAPVGRANECWVEVVPGQRTAAAATLAASMPSALGVPVRAVLETAPEDAVDNTLLTLEKWTPIACAVAAGLVVALSLVLDRGGVALLRILGLDRRRMLVLGGLRYTAMSCLGLLVAAALALTALTVTGVRVVEGAFSSVVPAYCVVVLVGAAGYARTPRNLLVRLRDR